MDLVEELVNVVGKKNVITDKAKSLRFRKGYRSGKGDAVAVVFSNHFNGNVACA